MTNLNDCHVLVEGTELRIKSELAKVRTIPIETAIESKKRRYAEIDREIDVWRIRLGEELSLIHI